MKKISNILWGVVLIAVGAVIALNAVGVTNINVFFDGWWTLFLIVPGVIGLFSEGKKTGSIILICIGAVLLLMAQGVIDSDLVWKLAIPVAVIAIGLKLVLGGIAGARHDEACKKLREESGSLPAYCVTFSGQDISLGGEKFEGAKLDAVFGGIKLDLQNAIIEGDCIIELSAIFGGVDIFVPDNVKVKVKSTSIFGGITNKAKDCNVEGAPTVYVNGTCMFGGADIKRTLS